jgi:hypothetical protein
MYSFEKFEHFVILVSLYKFEAERTVCLFGLAAAVLPTQPLLFLALHRVFIGPLSLYPVLMAIQGGLQCTILQYDVASGNANVEPALGPEHADRVDQVLPRLESTVQVLLYVLFQKFGVVVVDLRLVEGGRGDLRSHALSRRLHFRRRHAFLLDWSRRLDRGGRLRYLQVQWTPLFVRAI